MTDAKALAAELRAEIKRLRPLTYLRVLPDGVSLDPFWVERGKECREAIDTLLARLGESATALEALAGELDARERDLSLVLASLRNLEAATEEYLAEEEGVLIGEIEDEQKLRSIYRAALSEGGKT